MKIRIVLLLAAIVVLALGGCSGSSGMSNIPAVAPIVNVAHTL